MKTAALHNLGCKVNAYEMDAMQQALKENGYRIVPFEDIADVYIVNTCTVTNIADRKSRQMLHRAKKQNPDAVVVAVGCYVQNDAHAAEADPYIDLVIGNNRKKDLVQILEAYFQNIRPQDTVIEIAKTSEYEEMQIRKTAEHTRAYIKIQDGCNQFCSYCAIPYVRGRVRSRKPEQIIEEVRALSESGYREVVLTGIHISSYGLDFMGIQSADYRDACEKGYLADLIEALAGIPGIDRIRLGSLEPRLITEPFVRRLSGIDKLCPHFHLSLQSGCDETLKRMNRHYNTEQYAKGVELLRRCFINPAITTDIIVGFPGETQTEFEKSEAFIKQIGFYETHVFKYSKRKGTAAAQMADQVAEEEKANRSDILLALNQKNARSYREAFLGRELEILSEEEKEIDGRRYLVGHTPEYLFAAVEMQQIFAAVEAEPVSAGTMTAVETEPESAETMAPNQLIRGTAERFLTEDILLLKQTGKESGHPLVEKKQ